MGPSSDGSYLLFFIVLPFAAICVPSRMAHVLGQGERGDPNNGSRLTAAFEMMVHSLMGPGPGGRQILTDCEAKCISLLHGEPVDAVFWLSRRGALQATRCRICPPPRCYRPVPARRIPPPNLGSARRQALGRRPCSLELLRMLR